MAYLSNGSDGKQHEFQKKKLLTYLKSHPDATRLDVEFGGMLSGLNLYGGLQKAKNAAGVGKEYNLRSGGMPKADLNEVERKLRARMKRNQYIGSSELSYNEAKVVKQYGGIDAFRKKVLGFSKLPRRDHVRNKLKTGR